MRKLIMWNVITLDGYFEGEKGWDLSFHQIVWGPELERFISEQLQTVGEAVTLVRGRRIAAAAHLAQAHAQAGLRQLPRGFGSGEAAADDVNVEGHRAGL